MICISLLHSSSFVTFPVGPLVVSSLSAVNELKVNLGWPNGQSLIRVKFEWVQ